MFPLVAVRLAVNIHNDLLKMELSIVNEQLDNPLLHRRADMAVKIF